MHPAKEGFAALPFFDEFDLSTVDILLISQYVGLFFIFQIFLRLAWIGAELSRRGICATEKIKPHDAIVFGGSSLHRQADTLVVCSQHVYQKSIKCLFLSSRSTILFLHCIVL